MSDSDDEPSNPYVDFRDRPEWKDVVPVTIDESHNPLCPIAYTAQFTHTMDYFRAILNMDERSSRALALTEEVIVLNAANYTAWHFRRLCLDALKSDLKKEMAYVDRIANRNPKNYQLWYHRKWLVEHTHDASQELAFTVKMFVDDSKNYHAWAHRQWVLETYKLWDGEFAFIEEMLKQDPRNNSAWNQRFFVVSRTTGWEAEGVRAREIDFAFKYMSTAPNNQSPWNYLKGVMGRDLKAYPHVRERIGTFIAKFPGCINAMALSVDFEEAFAERELALELCRKVERMDPVHAKYWDFRARQIQQSTPSSSHHHHSHAHGPAAQSAV